MTTQTQNQRQLQSPFCDSKTKQRKAKILLYGSYGSGKTILSLRFPKPVIIDLERGSECYSGEFDFKVFHTTEPDRVRQGVDWLVANKTDRQTIVLDSMTEYWSALQVKWSDIFLRRNKGKGNKEEYYDLQPRDWNQIKNEFKDFLRRLLALDMHVICTCRVKDLYSEDVMLKKVGETFDSDRSLPYLFDTVVRLDKSTDGRYVARVEKDRTNRLPMTFEANYFVFALAFELEGWDSVVIPDQYLPQQLRGKNITGTMLATNDPATEFEGKERKYKGRQLLHIWERDKNEIARMLAKLLLSKYPSQAASSQAEQPVQAAEAPQPQAQDHAQENEPPIVQKPALPTPDEPIKPLVPDITKPGWEDEQVNDYYLRGSLSGKVVTFRQLATDEMSWTARNGQTYAGRQLVHMWESGQDVSIKEVATALLVLFPSEEKTSLSAIVEKTYDKLTEAEQEQTQSA